MEKHEEAATVSVNLTAMSGEHCLVHRMAHMFLHCTSIHIHKCRDMRNSQGLDERRGELQTVFQLQTRNDVALTLQFSILTVLTVATVTYPGTSKADSSEGSASAWIS